MRYAILADIHGNFEALQAVMDDMALQGVDECLCLGDIIGYGANPEECVRAVRKLGALCVAGNHDHAAIGRLDVTLFNMYARKAAAWTSERLSKESAEFLLSLSLVERLEGLVMVHGSLLAPEMFNYIRTLRDAEVTFNLMLDCPLCFCGHSHVPLAFYHTDPITYCLDDYIEIEPGIASIVNVGSVGQPRDERPEAAYGIYDTEKLHVLIRRVAYDIETASHKIIETGLPKPLAQRLWLGR